MSGKSQKPPDPFERSAVPSITKAQYYQLVGLAAAYKAQYAVVNAIEKSAYAITQEKDYKGKPEICGHTYDWLNESLDLDEMLDLLKIKVRR